jgi:hypothetical protein
MGIKGFILFTRLLVFGCWLSFLIAPFHIRFRSSFERSILSVTAPLAFSSLLSTDVIVVGGAGMGAMIWSWWE